MKYVSAVWLIGIAHACAGEPFKPGKLPKEEIARLHSGLSVRFESGGVSDTRRARLAALHVPAGDAVSPWLAPGPFTATFSGYIKAPAKADYTFRLIGAGTAVVHVNGKVAARLSEGKADAKAEAILLAKGYNLLELRYTSPAQGDATLRLSWVGEGFAEEPVPPDTLFARKDEAGLVAGSELREGRLLYVTHGCIRCHAAPGKLTPADCKMPEVAQQGPSLIAAGSRLQSAWLRQWLVEPRSLRSDATMPQLLGDGANANQAAADLAAFLGDLRDDVVRGDATGDAGRGGKLYRSIGCVACHSLQDPKKADPHDRLSLHYVNAKFVPGTLAAFLREPHRHHPWIRMPDFKLKDMEVADLVAFLKVEAKGTVTVAANPAGDRDRGAKLFQDIGCAHCHATNIKDERPAPRLAAPTSKDQGCLATAPDKRGRAPDFGLTAGQRQALVRFLTSDAKSLTRDTPAEFAARQVSLLQCAACHRRDGALTRWHNVLEDDGELPEYLPLLTWTGEKLKPVWTAKLLGGQHDHRARPWLKARMPAFPARAAVLAVGLSHEHGFAADDDAAPPFDAKLAAIGTKLLPQQGGFNCIQCHAVGKQPPTAPFEAPGINLLDAALRIRYSYYPRWMLDPPRVDPTTKMTKLAADGVTTPLKEVLNGDARRQFDALWHCIQSLPKKE